MSYFEFRMPARCALFHMDIIWQPAPGECDLPQTQLVQCLVVIADNTDTKPAAAVVFVFGAI
jgi:hypothetical protein